MSALAASAAEPASFPRGRTTLLRRREFWLSLLAHALLLSWLGWPTLRPAGPPARPLDVYVVDELVGSRSGVVIGKDADVAPAVPMPAVAPAPLRRVAVAAGATRMPVADLAPRMQPAALEIPLAPAWPPSPGATAAPQHGLALRLSQHLRRHQFYPRAARRAGIEGALLLRLRLDGDGRVLQASLAVGSGFAVLDRAALELVNRAQPFPPPRQHAGLELVEIELPLDYRLASLTLAAEAP